MKIIDKNTTEQTRGIFRKEGGPPTQNASAWEPNEWRDIPAEKGVSQVLSDEEILELSELVVKVEQHYGFPVDVEWARDSEGKFYIVQSRPITTLTNKSSSNEASDIVSRLTDVHTFELVCAFPFFPVLTLEPMPYGYEKNPYYEKIGVHNGCRVAVGILDTTYEGWIDRSTMPVISDPNIVAQIERDTREYVPKTRALLSEKVKILEHWNADTKQLETLVIETSRLMSETYQLFGAYLDDSLVTTDETMIHDLQQGRLELDYLATDYFTLHDKILTVFKNTYGRAI